MSPSDHLRATVCDVVLILEDGRELHFKLTPDNHGFVHQYVNHRATGTGLGKYMGGEFLEYTVHWVAPMPDRLPAEAAPAEVLRDGEEYVPTAD